MRPKILLLVLMTGFNSLHSQPTTTIIPFLNSEPAIDGLPAGENIALQWRDFAYQEKSDPANAEITIRTSLFSSQKN